MNISTSFLFTNQLKRVPVPTPGEEVTSGFTWTYSNPVIHYKCNDVDRGYYNPTGSWTTSTSQSNTQYTNWKQYSDAVPADVGWHQDLYYRSGYMSNNVQMKNVTGSIVLNISTLPIGKYVAVFNHWYGSRYSAYFPTVSNGKYDMDEFDIISLQTITMGANGIVYGAVQGIEEYICSELGYALGTLGGIHIEQRCEFVVSSGDTTKTFTYGDSTFGLSTLCTFRHRGAMQSKYDCFLGSYYNATTGISSNLYTSE